ncbi:hypothetical protein Tco_0586618 [Tanacetum coccineum]
MIPLSRGSFDVIVGIDWLSKRKFVIGCYEKVVRIPLEGDEIFRVHGERTLGAAKALMNAKVDEPRISDIPVVPLVGSKMDEAHASRHKVKVAMLKTLACCDSLKILSENEIESPWILSLNFQAYVDIVWKLLVLQGGSPAGIHGLFSGRVEEISTIELGEGREVEKVVTTVTKNGVVTRYPGKFHEYQLTDEEKEFQRMMIYWEQVEYEVSDDDDSDLESMARSMPKDYELGDTGSSGGI